MNLFSRSKSPSSLDVESVTAFIEKCEQLSTGDATRLDTESLDGTLAQLAQAVNAIIDGSEEKINAYEQGIGRVSAVITALRNGDFEQRLIDIGDDDVTAPLMHAINDFADVTDAFVREAGASLDAVSQNIFYRKVLTDGLNGEFHRTAEFINRATATMDKKMEDFTALTERLVDSIRDIAISISDMSGSVSEVSAISTDASARSTNVAAAVEETTASLQSIAAAAEEMLVSVGEINRQVTHSTEITEDAAQRMAESNDVARTLSEATANINEVLELINSIASQTNLLALNATIEAARAGDAGKGFAVVASEVKSLASQTAKATEDIAAQIGAMQSATSATVATIDKFGGTVSKINEISGAIASAITEQEATTTEISSNIQNAATGSQEVAENMQQVSTGAKKNSEAADLLLTVMKSVEKKSGELVVEATEFLETAKKTGTDG